MAIKFESQETGSSDWSVGNAVWLGQTFTPSTTHIITELWLYGRRQGTPGTVTVVIRATSGSLPVAPDLVTGSFNGSIIPESNSWINVDLGAGYQLDSGTEYSWYAKAPSAGAGRLTMVFTSSNPYAGGAAINSADSGGSWGSTGTHDFQFQDRGAAVLPSDAITRVTSLIHRYDRGTYTLELGLGEVVADFGLPEWESKPRTGIPKPKVPTREEFWEVYPGAPYPYDKPKEVTKPKKTIPTREEFWKIYPGVPYPYD